MARESRALTADKRTAGGSAKTDCNQGGHRDARGQLPNIALPWQAQIIDASHERCVQSGLASSVMPDFHGPVIGAWRDALGKSEQLRHGAIPVMNTLYQQIARSRSMVVLTDYRGLILETVGDDEFLESAEKVALANGVDWSESQKGTNAIGTAIVDGAPTLVHGNQHFLRVNQSLTCSASPIYGPTGRLMGVLDVTGDKRSYHQHTMALVNLSVTMIENNLVDAIGVAGLRIDLHRRPEFLSTLSHAIISVDLDGRIVGSNAVARQEFLSRSDAGPLEPTDVMSLFGMGMAQLVDCADRQGPHPVRLRLQSGETVFARLRLNRITRSVPARAVREQSSALSPDLTADCKSGFDELDLGDTRIADILVRLERLAGHPINLILAGPLGCGKRTLARAMHQSESHVDAPCLEAGCAALKADGPGVVEHWLSRAAGGTLILESVEALDADLQVQLLYALQADQAARPFRVICTTTGNLANLVATEQFNAELYHRLNGLTLEVPGLAERTDINAAADCIAREIHSPPNRISAEVCEYFISHPWPGNLRQLANVVRVACLVAGPGELITPAHLPADFKAELTEPDAGAEVPCAPVTKISLRSQTDSLIRKTLEEHGGNVSATARKLGISRNTIYRYQRRAG